MGLGKLFFVLGLLGLGFWAYLAAKKSLKAQKKPTRSDWIRYALWGFAAVLLLAVITGRAPALFALVGAAIPVLTRFGRTAWQHWPLIEKILGMNKAHAGASGGGNRLFSETIVLTINAPQSVDGVVRQGPWAGAQLSRMDEQSLQALKTYCQERDPEALQLLEQYLSSKHARHSSPSKQGNMDIDEALAVLGLERPFTKDDVTQAHKRLMSKVHPDKGGSNYLASQLNRAKATLMAQVA